MKEKVSKFFSSYVPLLIFSLVTSVLAIVYAFLATNSYKTYSFYGFNENINVSNGVISLTEKTTLFEGNNFSFRSAEDKEVVEYKLGYYFKVDDKYVAIIETEGSQEKAVSLKQLMANLQGFNFIEPAKGDKIRLEYKNRKNLKDNLYFRLTYKEKDSEPVTETIKILVTEVN